MKKDYSSIFASLFILVILGLIYFTMMPHWTSDDEGPLYGRQGPGVGVRVFPDGVFPGVGVSGGRSVRARSAA